MGIDAPDKLAQCVPLSKAGMRVVGLYRIKQVEDIVSGPSWASISPSVLVKVSC
jgi:hypothetical protein